LEKEDYLFFIACFFTAVSLLISSIVTSSLVLPNVDSVFEGNVNFSLFFVIFLSAALIILFIIVIFVKRSFDRFKIYHKKVLEEHKK